MSVGCLITSDFTPFYVLSCWLKNMNPCSMSTSRFPLPCQLFQDKFRRRTKMFVGKKSTPVILLVILLSSGCAPVFCRATDTQRRHFPGYRVITSSRGNPEGGDMATGGVDPGLLVSRSIFVMTYDDGKITNDQKYQIPDQVNFELRDAAFTSSSATHLSWYFQLCQEAFSSGVC